MRILFFGAATALFLGFSTPPKAEVPDSNRRVVVAQAEQPGAPAVAPAFAAGEDFGDPLAELASLGDAMMVAGPDGGGSIRAKKDGAQARNKRLRDPRNVEARVTEVKQGSFPTVAIKLQVTRPAQEGSGKKLERKSTLVVIPKYKLADGQVSLRDEDTRINAGAFYLQQGDRVMVRLGTAKGNLWTADYIERK